LRSTSASSDNIAPSRYAILNTIQRTAVTSFSSSIMRFTRLISIALTVAAPPCWAQATKLTAPRLTVSLSSSAVVLADDVTLCVKIENASDEPLWILGDLRWGQWGGLVLHVGPWGDDGPLPLILDHAAFSKDEITTEALVRLAPHTFLGKSRTIAVRSLVRHPGKYRLWVEYLSPIPGRIFETPFWSAERGAIVSPSIVLQVGKPQNQSKHRK
jgi:hypothetical protein